MLSRVKNSFLKPKQKVKLTTDLHSHLLPEIDDGCSSMDETLTIIKQMKDLGYKKLVVTPHIMLHKYPNTINIIKQGLFELRGYLKVKNIDIEIDVAAEYYCDLEFVKLIQKKELLSFGNKYVLFELPYATRPTCLEEVVKKLLVAGFKPVLAHPERYKFLTEVLEYRSLKELNVLFQLNVNSLGGFYGKEAQKKAIMLSQKGMVDFIGSDIHHKKNIDAYKENILSNHMEMLFRNNKILNDTI